MVNKKGAIQIQEFIIGILLFSLVIFGLSLFMGELSQNYNVPFDSEYNNTFNKVQSTVQFADSLEGKVDGFNLSSSEGTTTKAFTGSLNAVKSMTTGFTMVNDVIKDLGTEVGVDPIFAQVFVTIFGIILLFLIIAFVRGSLAITAWLK